MNDAPPTELVAGVTRAQSDRLAQRSPEWFTARCGSLGASSLHEIVARTKTGWSTSRANRMATLVCERLTGLPQDTYQNAAMLQGIEMEPQARTYYAFMQDVEVREVGLIRHPSIAGTHASPDGLIGDDGGLEIKCPQPAEHLRTLMEKTIADKYMIQMQWAMACSGRQWWDYCSYNASFPENLRGFITRVPRSDARIKELESAVLAFLDELELTLKKLQQGA